MLFRIVLAMEARESLTLKTKPSVSRSQLATSSRR